VLVAAAANLDPQEVPPSVEVSLADAEQICGADLEPGDTCEGVANADLLASYLTDDGSQSSSSVETPNENSAKAFAPGQIKKDGESARSYAPGQQKGDEQSAKDSAPGQQKKN
jgi:hypothetical protein